MTRALSLLRLAPLGLALVPLTPATSVPPTPALPPIHAAARNTFTAVLMWHDVVARRREVWFDIPLADLEEQFEEIRRRGLVPVTLESLARHLERGTPLPTGSVALTFDDNTLGLYRYLFPLLKRRRWPAALFVHTDYVGRTTGKAHCTWDQLREMERSGLVRVYPHTASHPADLRRLSEAALERELAGARRVMERELGGRRDLFAYSNGFYDERVARAVHRAGYRLAITEDRGAAQRSPNRMMVRRYSMHRRARQALDDTARARRRSGARP